MKPPVNQTYLDAKRYCCIAGIPLQDGFARVDDVEFDLMFIDEDFQIQVVLVNINGTWVEPKSALAPVMIECIKADLCEAMAEDDRS